jgi:hypothetical protein
MTDDHWNISAQDARVYALEQERKRLREGVASLYANMREDMDRLSRDTSEALALGRCPAENWKVELWTLGRYIGQLEDLVSRA